MSLFGAPKVKPLRISVVQYLNTVPLVRGFTHGPLRGKYELSFTVPSECAEVLRSGAADIAIIPAIEYPRIPNLVILPDLAIASKKSVRSLLLISKRPMSEVSRISLDRTSRSTQALVRLLCNGRWKIAPECFEAAPNLAAMLANADAALLIGDPALRLAIASRAQMKSDATGNDVIPGAVAGVSGVEKLYLFDIVEQWRAMTNLPAVLAVWAGRRDVVTPEVVQDFQDSLAFGWKNLDAVASESAASMNLPIGDLRRYFTENIDYHLDDENMKGLTRYYSLAAQLGLIPKMEGLAVAAEPRRPARYIDCIAGRKDSAHG
jgi:chorismate dehydratase